MESKSSARVLVLIASTVCFYPEAGTEVFFLLVCNI